MADDTKIILDGLPTGWTTVYTIVKNSARQAHNGSAFVTFAAASWATFGRDTPETPADSTEYVLDMLDLDPIPPADSYTWAHYRRLGGSKVATDPYLGGGGGSWDGEKFVGAGGGDLTPVLSAVAGVQGTLDGYATETIPAVVNDGAAATNGFVMSLADESPVPATFVWRGCFASFGGDGILAGGKFPIASFAKLSSTTARITFSPPLPAAPADGDTFSIL